MWEKNIDINQIFEIRTRSTVFFGCGAIEKIDFIVKELKSKDINKIVVVSGRNAYKSTGAWDYVEKALLYAFSLVLETLIFDASY